MKIKTLEKIGLGIVFSIGLVASSIGQTFDWAVGMGSTSNDVATDVVADGNGNVYTVGYFYGTVDFDPGAGVSNLTSGGGRDIFVSKMDASGNLLWAVRFGAGGDDIGNGIAIDGAGNVHITGGFFGTVDFDPGPGTSSLGNGTGMDIFVLKLTTNGAFVWVKQFGGNNDTQMANKIAVDASGNVYTTGTTIGVIDYDPGAGSVLLGTSPSTNTNMFISKLDVNGNYVWAKVIANSSNAAYGMDIAVSPTQEVYTTGYFVAAVDFDPGAGSFTVSNPSGIAGFVHKLDATGSFVWVKSFGTATIGNEAGLGIAYSNGKVYTTGYFVTTVDFDPNVSNTVNLTANGGADAFIQVLDSDGNFEWVKQLGGTGEDWGYGIALDAAGSVYSTGFFTGTVDFDPNAGTASVTAAGNRDAYISKLDINGNYQWGLAMGGTGVDTGLGIHVNSQGAVYTGGYYQASGDFDPTAGITTLTNAGANDIFLQRLGVQCLTPIAPVNATVPNTPTICFNTSTTLTASGIGTLGWYSASTGGTYLGGGSVYTTGNIIGTTSFYVQDSLCAAGPRTEIQVNVNAVVSDQSMTAAEATICQGGSTTITLNDSDPGINYYLRNDADNSIVQGPVAGTGNAIVFNTGALSATTTYNVNATSQLSSNNIGLDFDGVNDFVNLSNHGRGINQTVTVSARVKANVTGANQFIVYKYNSSNGFLLFIDASGKARFDGRDGSGSYRSSGPSTTTVTDGQWHDITGVVRSTGWEIYVDGVLQNSFACPPAISLYSTAIGYVGSNGTSYSNIDIDRVALFNASLSPATILSNATACLTGTEPNITGLFNFSDGLGIIANDESPTNADGTLTNMTVPSCWINITSDLCSPVCEFEMTQTVTVTVIAPPAQPTITASGPTTFCSGGSVTLTSSAGSGYLWSNGETSSSIVVSTGGTYTVTVGTAGCNSTSSGTVVTVNTPPSAPTITPLDATTFCEGGNVILQSSPGITYLWSTGATTSQINVSTTSTVTVQVTGSNGCLSSASAPLTVTVTPAPAQPTITAGGPTTFCSGGSVTLTSSPGTSYLWTGGSLSSSISPSSSGTFTVQVTNAAGCQSIPSAPVTVTVHSLPNAPIISPSGPTTFCAGGSVNLASSAGITYLWSNGSTNFAIDVTSDGTFTAQITDPNGCLSPPSAPVTVTVNPNPAISLGTVSNPTSCTNANGSIQVTGSGTGNLNWTGAASGTQTNISLPTSISSLNNGSYNITFTNSNGCTSNVLNTTLTAPSAPPVPTITAGGSTTFCEGGSVTLTSSTGTSYAWSTGETSASITVTSAGNYTVSITDASGCSSPASAATAVTVNTLPVIALGTLTNPSTCTTADGSVEVTGTGTGDLSWTGTSAGNANGVTLPYTIPSLTNGNYTVEFTDANGCTSSAISGTLTLPSAPPAPTITPSGSTTFCEGDMVTLTSSAGDAYLWSNGETTQSIVVNASDDYSVIITDASGCTSPSSAVTTVTVNAIPVATTSVSGITITADPAGASYLWIDCATNDPVSGETVQSFTPTANGSYAVVVTVNGCSDTSDCVVISTVGLTDDQSKFELSLQPNPSSDIVSIVCDGSVEEVLIYSTSGELVQVEKEQAFSVAQLSTGVYIVKVKTTKATGFVRLVKQ